MIPPPVAELHAAIQASRNRLTSRTSVSPDAARLDRLLARMQARLAAPPRVVLLGDFNSGKSTLANALIGAQALPTSIHANTRVPLHARFASHPSVSLELLDGSRTPLDERNYKHLQNGSVRMLHVAMPVSRLSTFELIDTPGLASGASRPDALVVDASKRAHVAVWCTAATQAWKATEAAAWSELPARLRPRSILVATLADALNTDRDRTRLETRLRAEAGRYFADVVMVSAAEVDALRRNPQATGHAERWVACGGAALDAALQRLLDNEWASRAISTER
ncbi:unnamed protein product, partial [Phaeothamnion confervicola]